MEAAAPVPPIRLLKTAGRTVAASSSSATAMMHTVAASSSPSPPPCESPTTDWDLADLIQQYATQEQEEDEEDENADDEEEQKEEQQEEEEEASVPTRTGSLNRERLLPNTRFLGNMLRSALSHNERVEHVGSMRGGADDAADIEVFDPRGTFTALSSTKQQQRRSRSMGSQLASATSGSLEAEAHKLIDAFEGGRAGVSSSVRKVRGRGRVLAHSTAANTSLDHSSSMSDMVVTRRSSSGTGTVAASHLHTDAQRAAYAVAHAKYRRARGVTLLHHIARAYAINIVIQPAANAGGEEQTQADADLESEVKAAASYLQAHAAAASAAASSSVATPASSTVARPTRIFSHSLANIGQASTAGARINSNVAAASSAAAAAAVSTAAGTAAAPVLADPPPASASSSGGKVRIALQRTSLMNAMAAAAPSSTTVTPPVATLAPTVVPRATFRRTFDAPLTAAPPTAASVMSNPAPVAAAAAAAPIRKVVSLVRSSSATATVPASSLVPPPASAVVRSVVVSSSQMADRKRKLEVESDAATSMSSPSPPAVVVAAASSRSLSSSAAPFSSASLPLSKRKRTGGILGAALQGIMGGSAR